LGAWGAGAALGEEIDELAPLCGAGRGMCLGLRKHCRDHVVEAHPLYILSQIEKPHVSRPFTIVNAARGRVEGGKFAPSQYGTRRRA
jgi:hypothetical protein